MKIRLVALAIVVSVGGTELRDASAATVQESVASESQQQEVSRLFRDYDRHLTARNFEETLRAATQLQPHATHDGARATVATMQATAMLGLGRDKEARKLIADAERLAPQNPDPSRALFIGALVTDRIDVAADALDRLIARFPDVARELQTDALFYFLRNEPEGQKTRNDDRRVALARLGYGGTLNGDHLTAGAIRILLERGDVGGAAELLSYVDEPQLIQNMLIQKRYSPLWPRLEQAAGPGLDKVRASSVLAAQRAYAEDPENNELLQILANSLRHAGRHAEAISLRSKLPDDAPGMASADEQLGWAVNNIALAMHDAGRADEADQLLAMLNEAPMEEGRGGWRVSMIINRLDVLVSSGRFDRALPLVELTEASARDDGNPYARQLVRSYKYCTLGSLGRRDEAAKLLPDLLNHAKDAYHATLDALLCAGQLDEAERVTLEALKSENSRGFEEGFARALQPRSLGPGQPTPWDSRWRELRLRPAMAREYERIARDMPEAFLPPARELATAASG